MTEACPRQQNVVNRMRAHFVHRQASRDRGQYQRRVRSINYTLERERASRSRQLSINKVNDTRLIRMYISIPC